MPALVFALPEGAPFTSDTSTLRASLDRALTTRGRTALFDAIAAGVQYLERGHHERKILILVSDGGDNASDATYAEVRALAQASNVLIYTVALADPIDRGNNPRLLKDLAEATGGERFVPRSIDEIGQVLEHIAQDIRHTYTLGYISTNATGDGPYRPVRLLVRPPDGRRVVVRSRAGYVAASEPPPGRP